MVRSSQKIPLASLSEDFSTQILYWAEQHDVFAWLDANDYPRKYTTFEKVLAVGIQSSIISDVEGAFDKLQNFVIQTPDYLFGFMSYDLKNDIESLTSYNHDELNFPELFFFQPQKLFFFHKEYLEIQYVSHLTQEINTDLSIIQNIDLKREKEKTHFQIKQRVSKQDYFEKFEKLQQYIRRGDTYETNLCFEYFIENLSIDPLELFLSLNQVTKKPFATFFKVNEHYILSASPERFVRKEGSKIITQPIKGTIGRGVNTTDDLALKKQLEENPKERSENIMIVDLVRNDLSKIASKGSVQVEELCKVYSFPTIHQMISTVVAQKKQDTHPVEVLKALFPMGSMTGAPKISTMKIIEDLEETKRGIYSGSVGYFTPTGDFDFNVIIRTILYNATNRYLSFSVGGAVTAKATKEQEYEECKLKAKTMMEALSQFSE